MRRPSEAEDVRDFWKTTVQTKLQSQN